MQGDLFFKRSGYDMFPTSASESSEAIRMTVADILTSMAMGAEPITPTTVFFQYAVFDGLSGVPTRTTPTLTPTTLRNIEQAIMDVEAGRNAHEHEAGFVPPLAPPIPTTVSQGSQQQTNQGKNNNTALDYQQSGYYSTFDAKPGMSLLKINRGRGQTAPINLATNSTAGSAPAPPSRRGGGRRPVKDEKLAPEEVERRLVRRERNKQAAARCRKRRMDHTMVLVEETEQLEEVKRSIQQDIDNLEHEKQKLERIIQSHRSDCRAVKVKTEIPEDDYAVPPPRKRPDTLQISTFKHPETPSAGLGLNFDSLMAGGTGLTPVTSAMTTLIGSFPCSTQNRNPPVMPLDLSSPDSSHSKLISL